MATAKPAQDFVPVADIRDGVVILDDGSLRAILLASSINFALKSEDEQTAILLQFQNFLNSLDFSVQFFIQSRRLDIAPYLAKLNGRIDEQENDLMRIQVREYMQFVKKFVLESSIMVKSFFIVVPYNPSSLDASHLNPLTLLRGKKQTPEAETRTFEEHRLQLDQRVNVVEQGITRTGVRMIRLGFNPDTGESDPEQLTELYYKLFNPDELNRPAPPLSV